jgi:hypothetical protein
MSNGRRVGAGTVGGTIHCFVAAGIAPVLALLLCGKFEFHKSVAINTLLPSCTSLLWKRDTIIAVVAIIHFACAAERPILLILFAVVRMWIRVQQPERRRLAKTNFVHKRGCLARITDYPVRLFVAHQLAEAVAAKTVLASKPASVVKAIAVVGKWDSSSAIFASRHT